MGLQERPLLPPASFRLEITLAEYGWNLLGQDAGYATPGVVAAQGKGELSLRDVASTQSKERVEAYKTEDATLLGLPAAIHRRFATFFHIETFWHCRAPAAFNKRGERFSLNHLARLPNQPWRRGYCPFVADWSFVGVVAVCPEGVCRKGFAAFGHKQTLNQASLARQRRGRVLHLSNASTNCKDA